MFGTYDSDEEESFYNYAIENGLAENTSEAWDLYQDYRENPNCYEAFNQSYHNDDEY
jgi:hypothetical protein